MNQTDVTIKDVSDTAFWVAYYRVLETNRPDALFKDPLANKLVDDRAERIASSMKETSAYTQFNVVIRTVIIDGFIQSLVQQGVTTVVNLGAGLDTRPYRLNLPTSLKWIEVDYPHIMNLKEEKLRQETPRVQLQRVSLDLANRDERKEFFKSLNTQENTLVLTEGVLPYLTPDQVSDLAEDLHAQNNFKYWIADYISPGIYKYLRTSKRMEQMKNAPFLFFPNDWFGFFKVRGWNPEDVQYIPQVSRKLKRLPPMKWYTPFMVLFMSKKMREAFMHSSGYMIMRRS